MFVYQELQVCLTLIHKRVWKDYSFVKIILLVVHKWATETGKRD